MECPLRHRTDLIVGTTIGRPFGCVRIPRTGNARPYAHYFRLYESAGFLQYKSQFVTILT